MVHANIVCGVLAFFLGHFRHRFSDIVITGLNCVRTTELTDMRKPNFRRGFWKRQNCRLVSNRESTSVMIWFCNKSANLTDRPRNHL